MGGSGDRLDRDVLDPVVGDKETQGCGAGRQLGWEEMRCVRQTSRQDAPHETDDEREREPSHGLLLLRTGAVALAGRGPCVAGALWPGERVQMRVLTADRIGLLGTPALITEDGPVPLRLEPKALALLGYVATAGRPVSRRDLARLLFPDADDARGALRWQLTRLRSALPRTAGRHLRIEREEVALALATDVAAFRAAAES